MTDQVDSVNIVLNDSGLIVSQVEFLPFGETWTHEGDMGHAAKYNSQELDKETNYYFYNARHYDPEICRFVTADTIIPYENETQSWNRFSYVRNNPIVYSDPTGHQEVEKLGMSEEESKALQSHVDNENKKVDGNTQKQAKSEEPSQKKMGNSQAKAKGAVDSAAGGKHEIISRDDMAKTSSGDLLPFKKSDKPYVTQTPEKHPGTPTTPDMIAADFSSSNKNAGIYSTVEGEKARVWSVGNRGGYGNYIEIGNSETGEKQFYAHLKERPDYKVGDKVVVGQRVGTMGKTGGDWAEHLHVEKKQYNDKTEKYDYVRTYKGNAPPP